MAKFAGKFNIESNRLRGWDYSNEGMYFITIVTANRQCCFGEIKSGQMVFNDFGIITNEEWYKSFEIRQELFLDEYILMPNHLHAIIVLNKNKNDDGELKEKGRVECVCRDAQCICRDARPCVSTNTFQRKPKSISSFVAGFKSAVITEIDNYIDGNKLGMNKFNRNNPLWQSNYHDHIIRNYESYQRIKKYIIENPLKWVDDKFYNQ